jgi:hypothetical protein
MNKTLQLYFNTDNLKLAYYRVNCWSDKMTKDRFGLRAFGYDLDRKCEDLSLKLITGVYKPQQGLSLKFLSVKGIGGRSICNT